MKKARDLQKKIDDVLRKILEPPKLELDNPLLNILSTKAGDVLKTKYINDKDFNEKEIQDI